MLLRNAYRNASVFLHDLDQHFMSRAVCLLLCAQLFKAVRWLQDFLQQVTRALTLLPAFNTHVYMHNMGMV